MQQQYTGINAELGQDYFFGLESLYFCELGAHAKFRNPTTTPSGLLVMV